MKTPWPYTVLQAIGACLIAAGCLALLAHLAGLLREGYASMSSLIGGAVSLVVGIIFVVLSDLGTRLLRIEAGRDSEERRES